jgi:hypothetical protein
MTYNLGSLIGKTLRSTAYYEDNSIQNRVSAVITEVIEQGQNFIIKTTNDELSYFVGEFQCEYFDKHYGKNGDVEVAGQGYADCKRYWID